jgi:ABC-type multidrug transport system ATPase subunit
MNLRLEFDGIEKSFDERVVLSSIHMACDSGTITGLLGRNGSGKSTLMKIVFGTTSATFKSVRINGKALLGNYLKQRIIGYLPQHGFIPRYLKVSAALSYYNIAPSTVLDIFPDLAPGLNKPVKTLSGGYLRILETLIVLKSPCSFIMLDEPFSGLMPLHIEMMKKLILQEKANKGIIISDHLYRHILDISDKTYLLSNGKTYIIKDTNELIERGYLIAGDN